MGFVTLSKASEILGGGGSGDNFPTKKELTDTFTNIDTDKLSGYGNNDFVEESDVSIKAEENITLTVRYTRFNNVTSFHLYIDDPSGGSIVNETYGRNNIPSEDKDYVVPIHSKLTTITTGTGTYRNVDDYSDYDLTRNLTMYFIFSDGDDIIDPEDPRLSTCNVCKGTGKNANGGDCNACGGTGKWVHP